MNKAKTVSIMGVLLGIIGAAMWVSADYLNPDLPDFTPLEIPYQGVLEKDGDLIIGEVDFQVELYDDQTAGNLLWGPETHSEVSVYSGRFSLVIGSVEPIDRLDMDIQAVFLAVAVKSAGDADFVPLTGRQRLLSSPYAIRSYRAKYAKEAQIATTANGLQDGAVFADATAESTFTFGGQSFNQITTCAKIDPDYGAGTAHWFKWNASDCTNGLPDCAGDGGGGKEDCCIAMLGKAYFNTASGIDGSWQARLPGETTTRYPVGNDVFENGGITFDSTYDGAGYLHVSATYFCLNPNFQ